jgi:hypothetical protein
MRDSAIVVKESVSLWRNFMSKKVDEVIARAERLQRKDMDEPEKEHTLRENALDRAKKADDFNAGTAFDWEDLEAYQAELDRMDKEGPGVKKN